jgi:hypothetical protein
LRGGRTKDLDSNWRRVVAKDNDAPGMPAVLSPPEEEKDVKTAIGAARAKMARGEMRKAS